VAVILVDDRSLESLGRWPFSRALFAHALAVLDQAGAKVVVFDFLFTEPDEPIPAELREAARTTAEAFAGERGGGLRAALEKLADSDRDNRFAAAIRASGHVLLPIGLSFVDTAGEEPAWLSQSTYALFEKSELFPVFPLRPKLAVLPIEALGIAAAGVGHAMIAYDRDGAPRLRLHRAVLRGGFPALNVDTRGRRLSRRPLAAGRAGARHRPPHWRPRGADRPSDAVAD